MDSWNMLCSLLNTYAFTRTWKSWFKYKNLRSSECHSGTCLIISFWFPAPSWKLPPSLSHNTIVRRACLYLQFSYASHNKWYLGRSSEKKIATRMKKLKIDASQWRPYTHCVMLAILFFRRFSIFTKSKCRGNDSFTSTKSLHVTKWAMEL